MTQNVLISADASRQALGISDMLNTGFRYGLAILILFTIFALVFLYLFYTHIPIPPGVTTTIHATTNALTTINSGPNIVPLNGVT